MIHVVSTESSQILYNISKVWESQYQFLAAIDPGHMIATTVFRRGRHSGQGEFNPFCLFRKITMCTVYGLTSNAKAVHSLGDRGFPSQIAHLRWQLPIGNCPVPLAIANVRVLCQAADPAYASCIPPRYQLPTLAIGKFPACQCLKILE